MVAEGARFLANSERHEIALKITESGAVSYQIITIFINDILKNYGDWHGVGDALRSTADASSNPRFGLTPDVGTSLAEYYHGGGGNDIINTRGGADWIWGGIGNDEINLRGAPVDNSIETIVYRFTSASTGFEATDGVDTITNFRRGEDVLIFSDLAAAPITSLGTFLSTSNRGTSGGQLNIRPIIIDGMLEGVEILFGLKKILKITYTADSRVEVGVDGAYTAATYLGTLSGGTPNGYDATTGLLTDNTLLTNYFGAGKLQVIDDQPFHARGHIPAEYAIAGSPHVIIGENLHAVEITPDPDGIPDGINAVRYQWFTIDADGTETDISGATAATYTFQAGDSITADYGVKISYTDKAGRAHNVEAIHAPFYFVAGSRDQTVNVRETDAITALESIITGVRAVTDTEDTIRAYHVEGAPWVEIDVNTGAVSIAEGTKIDYEENSQIIVSITAISSAKGHEATTKLTINVENVEEGSAVFDIGGYIASGQTLTAALRTDDPDGVDADGYSYQWFTTTDGGTTKTDISGADEASYAIKSGDDLTKTYGVTITYTDGYGTDYEGTDAITLLASKSTAQFGFGKGDQTVSIGEGADGLVEVTASATLNGRGTVTVSPDGKSWTFVLDAPLPDNNLHNESFSLTIMHPDGTTETRDVDLRLQNLGGYVYTLGFGNPQNVIAAYNTPITQPIASVTPRLATIAATGDGTISYSITSGNDDNAFAIDAATGIITLIKALDYETATSRTLEITATDAGNSDTTTNKNTATITINVENRNDNAPVFDFDGNGVYNTVTIPETIAPGEVVKWIQATDADGDRLTYRLTSHTEHYEIDEDTGRITVKEGHGLDFEGGSASQRVQFSVSDGTNTIHSNVRVTLTNVNDEPSEFEGAVSGSDTAILLTGTAPTGGTSTGYRIQLFDADELGWDDHEIQIQGTEDRFEFRNVRIFSFGTGAIYELYLKAGETLPEGAINLEYRIFDGANYTEGTQSITVNAITGTTFIADEGDQTINIDENDADASVATVQAIGIGTVTYSITSGNSGGAFTLDSATGIITLTGALDYETATSYSLVITATDDGNSDTNTNKNTATITINVRDVNDQAPALGEVQLDADAPGAMLGLPTLAGATSGDDTALTGTAGADHIAGGDGVDTITSGGGADHIFGDAGDDVITLSDAAGSVETVYYRFSSQGSFPWGGGAEGGDTIHNFRRGEDRLVLIDTDGTPIDLDTFISNDNRGSDGGRLTATHIYDQTDMETLQGLRISFNDGTGLLVNFHSDDYEVHDTPVANLPDHTMIPSYFNIKTGDDNLQIITEADLPTNFGANVFISEKYTAAHGVFANLPAPDADGTSPNNQVVGYDITGGTGMGIFEINDDGEISVADGATLDYDTATSYTLTITATDGGTPAMTSDAKTITIGIFEDPLAKYSISKTGTRLTAALDSEDPDGRDGARSYQWFKIETDNITRTNVGTDSAIYDIPSADADLIHGVIVTYTDSLDVAAGTETQVEALTTPIKITNADGDIVPSYTGTVSEDADSDDQTIIIDIDASVDNAPDGHTIRYAFRTSPSTTSNYEGSGVFIIDNDDGTIRVFDEANLDYETTQSYTLTVSIAYDPDGDGTTKDDIVGRDVQVIINVQDVNEHAPVIGELQVAEGAMAGLSALAGATTGIDTLTGTADDDYIDGGAGNDIITSGGGDDHIVGGAGNDGITLSSAKGSVETIYYHFSSAGTGAWTTPDGSDTVNNFRLGEDRLVFVDTDGTPISLTEFLSASNVGSAGGRLTVRVNFPATKILGVEISIGSATLTINYATDSQVLADDGNDFLPIVAKYLGALDNSGDPTGATKAGAGAGKFILTDHANLLPNYFGDGTHTNLQVVGTTTFGVDVLISERHTFADGVFATVPTMDDDGSAPNNEIGDYDITGGTGRNLFVINDDGGISVKAGATLDYDTATSYTLTITATDGGTPAMTSDAKTITIGILEDFISEYSISKTGNTYSATLDTPDSDGVDMDSIEYQWFTTPDGGKTKNAITGITDTISQTLNTAGHTLPDGQFYGVTVTYDDNAGNEDVSVDAIYISLIKGTSGADTALAGTADVDYIYGDAGADTITSGGGNDHILGGTGNDQITLASASGSVETIYYRFSSAGRFPAERDGTDTINGFRRGEDRLVLIDTDSESTLDLDTLLSDAQNAAINIGTFGVNPLFDVATTEATVNLIGVEIQFDEASIVINYDSGSYVTVRSGGSWQTAGDDYLGALDNGAPVELGTSGGLLDNTLLPNYFGDTGNTNLQITGDDMVTILDLI